MEEMDGLAYLLIACHCYVFAYITYRLFDCLRAGRPGDRIPVGARFSAPVQTGPEAHPGSGSFPEGKVRTGCVADPSPPSSDEVKNRIELYLYSL